VLIAQKKFDDARQELNVAVRFSPNFAPAKQLLIDLSGRSN